MQLLYYYNNAQIVHLSIFWGDQSPHLESVIKGSSVILRPLILQHSVNNNIAKLETGLKLG